MAMDWETFKKNFPNLAREIEGNICSMKLGFENSPKSGRHYVPKFRGYNPNVIDFIRRCDTELQALEIVDYLEKRNELPHEEAERIRVLLKEKGVRFFGSKKESGWYFKEDPHFSRR
ncbi:MAG: DUF2095 domain-containing protein [Candidatus Verstraetearchaeota archaeon]|jgi:hypothetical protein|nr:DUF2095 domain-containing protein [Candidatus Verstraetearchaeota archaeon]